jgi:chromosome segregation ATPase
MSSYNRYFSPAQVESDQKDLIISQIKAEIFELRQGERDYVELAAQLRNLEHRYNLLQDEKIRSEADFKARNELNFKTIANLKTDIDTLKSSIAESNIEYQELRAENNAIKDISEQRTIDLSKLKNELQDAIAKNNILNEDRRALEIQVAHARDEKRVLLSKIDHASNDADELNYRNNELEKIIRELEYEKSRLEKQSHALQGQIDSLTAELINREGALKDLDNQVADSQRTILNLEAEIKDLERLNEKARGELVQQQRGHQNEVTRNLELNARANSLENTLRARDIQLDDLRRETESLKHAHSNLLDTNFQLNKDLDTLRRHIDIMTGQNHELVDELERFSEQDEHVRSILNRRGKVSELKNKSEINLKQSVHAIEHTQSPARIRNAQSRRSPYK